MSSSGLHELPNGWIWVKLKDVASNIQPGFACGKRDNNGYVQLRMNNIGLQGKVVLVRFLRVPKSETSLEKYRLEPGDVLFNNTNSPELIGKTAIFRGEINDCVYSNHITRLRVDRDLTIPEWTTWLLVREYQLGTFDHMCHRFVGQAGISRSDLLSLPYPLPPLNEQKRTVAKIEELLQDLRMARNALQKAPALIRQFRQSILAAAFSGKLTRWDPNDEPRERLLERIQGKCTTMEPERHDAQPSFEMPDGWLSVSLGKLCNVEMGQSPPGSSYNREGRGVPLLNGPTEFGEKYPTAVQWTTKPTKICVDKDILICVRGNTTGKMNIADRPYCIGRGLAAIRPIDALIEQQLIFYFLLYKTNEIMRKTTGSTFPNLSQEELKGIPFHLPPLGERRGLVSLLDASFGYSESVEKIIRSTLMQTAIMEESILKRAFMGKLVTQDPNDEPASILLERIKARHAISKKRDISSE